MKSRLRESAMQCRIMKASGPECRASEVELRNQIYKIWDGIWTDVFSAVGQPDAVTPDEFFRQHALLCITTERQELLGMQLFTFFDLESAVDRDHSYFSSFNDLSFMRLKKEGIRRVMSIEYLTVIPSFRKYSTGIPWGEVLIALGQRVMMASGYDAVLGTTRVDLGVDRMCDRLGFQVIQTGIKKYDYTCSLTFCSHHCVVPHPDQSVDSLIGQLWNSRIDTANVGELKIPKMQATGGMVHE